MQRLTNLDQTIVVPINDERLGTSYEMQVTLEEFFEKFFDGLKLTDSLYFSTRTLEGGIALEKMDFHLQHDNLCQ